MRFVYPPCPTSSKDLHIGITTSHKVLWLWAKGHDLLDDLREQKAKFDKADLWKISRLLFLQELKHRDF